jgi:hypothetical protein
MSRENSNEKLLEGEFVKEKTPNYYIGCFHGIKASDVADDFNLSYHLGSTLKYVLRAGKKYEDPRSDIRKAISHLHLELEKLDKYDEK